MPTYAVTVPVYTSSTYFVEAATEEEAITIAQQRHNHPWPKDITAHCDNEDYQEEDDPLEWSVEDISIEEE